MRGGQKAKGHILPSSIPNRQPVRHEMVGAFADSEATCPEYRFHLTDFVRSQDDLGLS